MIEWLNNLHPAVNALVVLLGTTTALLTLVAAGRSCWRAGRKLFRRRSRDANKVEQNENMRERTESRFRKAVLQETGEGTLAKIKGWPVALENAAQQSSVMQNIKPGSIVAKRDDSMDALAYITEAQAHASEEWIHNPLMVIDEATQSPRRATDKEIREYEDSKQRKAQERLQQAAIDRVVADTGDSELRRSAMKRNIQEAMRQPNVCLYTGQPHDVCYKKMRCLRCGKPHDLIVKEREGWDWRNKP